MLPVLNSSIIWKAVGVRAALGGATGHALEASFAVLKAACPDSGAARIYDETEILAQDR